MEPTEIRMARLEENVNHLKARVDTGFKDVTKTLHKIENRLSELNKIYLEKEEYYRDNREKEKKGATFRDIALKIVTNSASYVAVALVAYILSKGGDIF